MMVIGGLFMLVVFGVVYGDPTAVITIENIDYKDEKNPYFANFEPILHPGGDKMSMKLPLKSDLPPDMMVRVLITVDGEEIPEILMTLCEAIKTDFISEEIIENGLPKGVFPEDCPIKANLNYEVRDWILPSWKVPPGIPDSPFEGVLTAFLPGKDPIVTITARGKLTHKVPGFGR